MNINIRYDLLEEVQLANKGFSLKRYAKTVLKAATIGTIILLPMKTIDGLTIRETFDTVVLNLEIYAGIYGLYSILSKTYEQENARENLNMLSLKLNKHNIDINPTMLLNAKDYKTKYSLSFTSFPPDIQQKRYISFLSSEDAQNIESHLLQEHVVGTTSYSLSQSEKVYSKNN